MKSIALTFFLLFLLITNSRADDAEFGEADIEKAKLHQSFVEKIKAECIEETGVDAKEATKILLGTLDDESDEAKVSVVDI